MGYKGLLSPRTICIHSRYKYICIYLPACVCVWFFGYVGFNIMQARLIILVWEINWGPRIHQIGPIGLSNLGYSSHGENCFDEPPQMVISSSLCEITKGYPNPFVGNLMIWWFYDPMIHDLDWFGNHLVDHFPRISWFSGAETADKKPGSDENQSCFGCSLQLLGWAPSPKSFRFALKD